MIRSQSRRFVSIEEVSFWQFREDSGDRSSESTAHRSLNPLTNSQSIGIKNYWALHSYGMIQIKQRSIIPLVAQSPSHLVRHNHPMIMQRQLLQFAPNQSRSICTSAYPIIKAYGNWFSICSTRCAKLVLP